MPLLPNIITGLKTFLADDRGAAGVEFLMTLPLLIGTMVFTAEYGSALRTKMVLNTATADVTRFLARAPIKESTTENDAYEFYNQFLVDAQAIMEARMGGTVVMTTEVKKEESLPYDLRTDPYIVTVTTNVELSMPLLGFINDTITWANAFERIDPLPEDEIEPLATVITMSAIQSAPWIAGSAVGAADCRLINRELDLCAPPAPES